MPVLPDGPNSPTAARAPGAPCMTGQANARPARFVERLLIGWEHRLHDQAEFEAEIFGGARQRHAEDFPHRQ